MEQGSVYYDRIRRRYYLILYIAFTLGILSGALLFRHFSEGFGAIGCSLDEFMQLICSRGLVSLLLLSFLPLFFVTFLSFTELGHWALPGYFALLGLLDALLLSYGVRYWGSSGILLFLMVLLPQLLPQLFLYPALSFRLLYGSVSLKGTPFRWFLFLSLGITCGTALIQRLLIPVFLQRLPFFG